jgi:pimeloyl-ACP methyl ester carboxylesterase
MVRRIFASAALLIAALCHTASPATVQPTLVEDVPWLVKNQGPGTAKGVIYFVHGYARTQPIIDDFKGAQPFLVDLNRQGWDIIGAKYPYSGSGARATDLIGSVGPGLAARVVALRKEGYQRVVFAGRSWGAWLALAAASRYRMKADALVLIVPATYGKRTDEGTGKPNPNFVRSRTDYAPLIAGVSTPSIVVFFKDDDFDPGGRGAITEATLGKRGVPHILIDGPAGLTGHGADWFPLFDYAFGDCFATFLAAPANATCQPRPLDDTDFRSVLLKSQITDAQSHSLVTPSELAGRKFAVFAGDGVENLFHFTAGQSLQAITPSAIARHTVAARDGALCIDERCSVVVKWDAHHMIGFDPQKGAAISWWTETEETPQ